MLSHFFRDDTQSDASEIIDRESSVLRVVHWEHLAIVVLHGGILEPLSQLLQSHLFHHLLHQDLDKDTTGRSGIVFVHFYHGKDRP